MKKVIGIVGEGSTDYLIRRPLGYHYCKKKEYHEIRVPGKKKNVSVYSKFVLHLLDNWENVKDKCPGAKKFEEDIQEKLHIS